ncbi:hypothetical protein ACHAXA_009256 [Cyclostephanos tholiformis]|uniref:RRM domain-containing protein n=1 Tax=Cyclostephanos tholiformis TaxID=382380 RepID=A0ABD3RE99_9STRA
MPNSDDGAKLIHVQLPTSLLSNLSDKSRIEIIRNEVGAVEDGDRKRAIADDGLTLKISLDGSSDSFPLEIDRRKQHAVQWYQSVTNREDPRGGEDRVPQNEIRHIGTTLTQYIITAPSFTFDLKKIGEKTRRLLEEERNKRKEIVRLDGNDHLPLPEKKARASEKIPQSCAKMPQKKIGTKANTNARKRKRHAASNVDGWMPNVDDLRSDNSIKTDQSNIVRLHGLPVGIKPEQIRKYFHGLNPSLIFVLPSFPRHIHGWDATYDTEDVNNGCMVTRHPSHFRVLAKFTSSRVATAAIERSGESIEIDINGATYCEGNITGASISMTTVSKSAASFMQKHMAIPTQKGEPVIITLKNAEKQLGGVIDLIWQMAIKMLDLKHRIVGKGGADQLGYLIGSSTEPTNKVQYQKLARLYNQLIDMHAELELFPGPLYTHTFDPTLVDDPVHRITQSVSNWLLDEISTLGRLLKRYRLCM